MDYQDANSSMLAKFAAASLSCACVVVFAGASPFLLAVIVLALLAARSFAGKLGRGDCP